MLRSLYSGVSGMKNFQVKLDVIGNNIANVNTVGFKKSRVVFQDVLSQNMAGATAPEDGERGGINPRQVGLGSQIGAIDVIHTPGSPMTTGVPNDLMIEGDGFFLVSPPGNEEMQYLTRAGNFTRDALGYLVTSSGYYVQGTGGPIQIDMEDYMQYEIAANGDVIGYNEEGEPEVIDTLVLGFVQNPGGLRKVGGSLYEITANAHSEELEPTTIEDAEGRNVRIIAGMLEMSNVDLTEEFTEMIIAQRGFQSNSRIITTSDEILQEVVNLKR
ncbi:flagellar hook-basal body complex protein [Bacillus horti]|uniref:Flagellar hook protein FlgE n=1 Tax=Caldalkalibacillus horti TaxID=77523 RepID=A0ABT9VUM1_9BACI|nr:flagellar hook-basal body complex protein [Bacillus horti]MDQ0164669.1 flagellar hook protein FlgE [Bacillus horti]